MVGGEMIERAKQMSLSDKQKISMVALVLGAVVFLGALFRFAGSSELSYAESGGTASARIDCIGKADFDACNDRVDRQLGIGFYEPWYEQHAVLAALAAGGVTFFVIAGGGRLLMK